jgi:hypothetical protein
MARDDYLVMRDLIDQQIVTADNRSVARVADVEAAWQEDGRLVLIGLCVGPQALARRVSGRLGPIARFLLREKFEHVIPMEEITGVSLDLRLRQNAVHFSVGQADDWVVNHILRFIPGNGRQ